MPDAAKLERLRRWHVEAREVELVDGRYRLTALGLATFGGLLARKLVYLAIRNHETTWRRPPAGWYESLAAFHAHFQHRLTRHA